jgi:hypothetical protein
VTAELERIEEQLSRSFEGAGVSHEEGTDRP